MDLMRSLYYIGLRMGDVIVYPIGCILGTVPHTKETLSDFFFKLWVMVKGIQQYNIGLSDIHKFSVN